MKTSALSVALAIAIGGRLQAQAGQVSGVVYDSLHRTPLRNAVVVATPLANSSDTAFHSAQSDEFGKFVLSALRPGEFRLTVEHPFIDSTGIVARPLTISVHPGENSAALAIPSVSTLRRVFCPAALADTTVGVMLGTVRRENGSFAARASVVFRWADFELDRATLRVNSRQVGSSVKADSLGVYRACGLPRGRQIFVQAQADSVEQSGLIEEQIGETGFLLRDFQVSRAPVVVAQTQNAAATSTSRAATPSAPRPGGIVLTGSVQGVTGEKVTSGQVTLLGANRTTSISENGEFRLVDVPSGTQGLEVLALGYSPSYTRVEISPNVPPVVVRMTKGAALLDSVRIVARRSMPSNRGYTEFDQRAARNSWGKFFTEKSIADRHAVNTTDLLQTVLGVHITPGRGTAPRQVSSSRGAGTGACPIAIYLNGMAMTDWDIDDIPPEALHGMEVYPSPAGAPIKYHATCGLILLWTK